ncbi:MAG: saccharopine dehydrogenase NADP-binding domain-containing protein [Wenzhouxiangella sp.]|nr:saccharopine dehydrogenase NADP-binding domain-containing protein [Wenzhouxiangella sp.]
MSKPHDLVIMGATGFTGRLVVEYLLGCYGTDGELNWAIAGRSEDKLNALRDELGAEVLPVIQADSHDRASLDQLVEKTHVVCSTVGPYALYGDELVAACVDAGTDYCDLTGEVPWMRRMLDQHAEKAKQTGARIVHCCGFDSVPSDMGVRYAQAEAKNRFGGPLTQIRLGVEAMRGKMSGGTAASMMNIIQESQKDPSVARVLKNPYALCPEGMQSGVKQPYVKGPQFDPSLNAWLAPFVMAAINTRVVHKSHALRDRAWGEDFIYDEAMMTGRGFKGRRAAWVWSLMLGGFALGAAVKPLRALMKKTVLPDQGEGPSREQQQRGFYKLRLTGQSRDGRTLSVRVTGDRDPGYGSTAKMLGEAAVCLATQTPRSAVAGGFWTPSTALGQAFHERLVTNAGLTFEVIEPSAP